MAWCRAWCVVAVMAGAALAEAPPDPAPATMTAAERGRVEQVIRNLGAEDFSVREKASREIQGLPAEAFEILEGVIADPRTDEEVRARIETAMPAFQQRVAQEIHERRRARDQAWELADALDSYEKVGRKDAAWDGAVRDGLQVLFGKEPVERARAAAAFRKAIDAGCNDPMVLHFYAAVTWQEGGAALKEAREDADIAAARYENGGARQLLYPAHRRLEGQLFAMRMIAASPESGGDDQRLLGALFSRALSHWPEAVQDPGISARRLDELATVMLERAPAGRTGEVPGESLFNDLARPLAGVPQALHIYDVLKGREELRLAWQSRGHDIAVNIPESRIEEMKKHVALARAYFEQAFALDVFNPEAPSYMIEVELLDPRGREEMEKWFDRAMIANPNNLYACNSKLNYLLPRWYGSHEEMLAFGRECLKKGTRVALTLVAAHQQIADERGEEATYFEAPAVWADIQAVYDGLLAKNPGNMTDRSNYLRLAVLGRHWQTAAKQQAAIGDHPDLSVLRSAEHYRELCDQIREHRSAEDR